MAEKVDRWIKNSKSATWIAKNFFVGARVHSFDPSWRFVYPDYIAGYLGGTFDVPDYVIGLIAEREGLPWDWGEEGHPVDRRERVREARRLADEERKRQEEAYRKLGWDKEWERNCRGR